MLLVGTFNTQKLAQRFCDYLINHNMESQIRVQDVNYEVWVLDNQHCEVARNAYKKFNLNPDDALFKVKPTHAARQQQLSDYALKRQYRRYFQRPSGNQVTISLIVLCIIVYALTFTPWGNPIYSYLFIALPGYPTLSLWLSQPWRLVTPMFLHFNILHILFNLCWLYSLGSLIETKEGKFFYIGFILAASLASGLLQYTIAGPQFGGMSGIVYALFAYIWISSHYNLRSGYYMSNQIVIWMLLWFVLCFTGFLGPVANFGHLGGLIVGAVFAYGRKLIAEHR